jgi:hypothetical protein
MNPLLEKYEELYGEKPEVKEEDHTPEYLTFNENVTNIIDDPIIGTASTASYIYGGMSNDTISLGTPFPSGYCYGEGGDDDHIYIGHTTSSSVKPSLQIDGKDIKDLIREEVERQLKEHREITDSQTKSVIDVLEKVKKGEVRIKSYNETVSHDLGGSTTYYTIELEK